jgi:hypothetical protein
MVTNPRHRLSSAAITHLNQLLDEALGETFPASDPIAIDIEPGAAGRSDTTPRPRPGHVLKAKPDET